MANFGLLTVCQFTTAQQRFGSIAKFFSSYSSILRKNYYISMKFIGYEAATKPSRKRYQQAIKKNARIKNSVN
jgi:hypothetical protein